MCYLGDQSQLRVTEVGEGVGVLCEGECVTLATSARCELKRLVRALVH